MIIVLSGIVAGGLTALALYGLATAAAAHFNLSTWKAMGCGLVALGLLGFLTFWATFFDVELTAAVQIFVAAGIGFLLYEAALRRTSSDLELIFPCLAVAIGTVVLLAWAFLPVQAELVGADPLRVAAGRWTYDLPGDNELPFVFAQQLRNAQIASPFYGDWLSSDRPPLQTGLYLLLDPLGDHRSVYQAISTAIQMLCLPAIWMLSQALGASRAWSIAAMLVLFMTPLVILNGIFVWPKLLAGSMLCVTAAVHFTGAKEPRSILEGLLAGGGASLAFLAHGATAFTLVGFLLAALVTLRLFSVRYVLVAAALGAACYLPWLAYQRMYDPPGDRLMKWHLAGAIPLDDRSLTETLADSYGALTPATWWSGRITNFATATTNPAPETLNFLAGKETAQDLRNSAFAIYPMGLGLFAIAFFALPLFLLYRPTRALAVAVGLGFLSWVILLFEPGQTITHQGSYFIQIGAIAAAVRIFSTDRITSWLGLGLVTTHVFLVGVVYALP